MGSGRYAIGMSTPSSSRSPSALRSRPIHAARALAAAFALFGALAGAPARAQPGMSAERARVVEGGEVPAGVVETGVPGTSVADPSEQAEASDAPEAPPASSGSERRLAAAAAAGPEDPAHGPGAVPRTVPPGEAFRGEGLSHAFSLWTGVRYDYAFDAPLGGDRHHAVAFDLSSRFALGGPVSYFVGLDVSAGGGDVGFLYEVEAHLVGVAARWDTGFVGLSSGIGLGGATAALPLAAQIPIELRLEASLGPLRILASATLRFVLGAESRQDGARSLSFADELGASLYVRVGGERRFWARTVAGSGPALGLFYRERAGSRIVGVALALALSGGR